MKNIASFTPAFIVVALFATAHAAQPDRADSLIDAAKQAMGGPAWDHVATWHETGRITGGGLTGTYDTWMDLGSLHNSGSYVLGPDSGGSGWDGKQAWTTDASKEVRVETSGEAIAQAIQDAYRGGYAFFFPQRFPGKREYAGTHAVDGVTYPAVKVTPQGAEPFEVWFDPATHYVVREVQLTGAQPHTFIFSGFYKVESLMVPKQTIDRVGGNPKFDTITDVTAINLVGPQVVTRYAPPAPPPNSAQWPAGKDSVTLPFNLRNNHIYVDASINGKPPEPFMFDTGATDIFDAAAAKRLGIKAEGALPGGGFGDSIASSGFARVKSVSLGGLTLPDQVFGTMDLGSLYAVEGTKSAGLLGYEFVKRAVLTIDYAARTLTFTKQESFHPPAGVEPIHFTFDSHVPMISGSVDGIGGEFELDTGSRGALTVMAPFAAQHDLIRRYRATRDATVGYGVGGPSKALLARAGKLDLAGVVVDAPVAELLTDKGGAAAAARTAGNIGGDILKRFTVVLDYAHQRLWLEPNALSRQHEDWDRSGLWIGRAADGGISVGDVTAGSAAAAIGIVTGDEILSVDGTNARDVALYDLREQFKGAVGTRLTLRVKGKQGERTVALALADQV